ncbi:hypothetical protein B0J13DRAFT_251562 [Dactylonectria estremocensis]|uniref:Uncharacterized protein n=1 Tax=Dactylonectria estremocensis TaxID=1079267 RepID=A0A9P9F2G6_9HYPO|nr:hypothetical protein B0J13DRAFT_251562 [Dactylonectria estremocensis]
MGLMIFYSPQRCIMEYYVQNDQAMYKIEFPFSYIKNIYIKNEAGIDPGGIVVELNNPPYFFMRPPPGTDAFFRCGDFTENQQASRIMIHHIGGDPGVLIGQLAELVSLPSFMGRHTHLRRQYEPYLGPSSMSWSRKQVRDPAIWAASTQQFTMANTSSLPLTRAHAEAGSNDSDFKSRLTELRSEQEEGAKLFLSNNGKQSGSASEALKEIGSGTKGGQSRTVDGEESDLEVLPKSATLDLTRMRDHLQAIAHGPKDEVAVTDSGYASLHNPNGCLIAKPSTEKGGSPRINTSPIATMNGIHNDDAPTLYSYETTIAPAGAQSYIAEICSDIYSNLNDCINAKMWPLVSKILPDLLKAFAVRLGSDCGLQANKDVMYFVHKRHGEVVSQLEAMFSQGTEEQSENCRQALEGMPLLDKMAMWQSRDDQDHAPGVEDDDYFDGVNDDEDPDDYEDINLPAYQKIIFDSPAYKWFLATCKKEVTLQQEGTNSCITTTESIRRRFIEMLPTGSISKRHAPSSHEMVFFLNWHQDIALRLERENIEFPSRPDQSFSSLVVLTGSLNQAQALTMKQYMSQTWPANGLQMLNALQETIGSPKSLESGKSLANEPIVAEITGSTLMVRATGPAYFIAECGEQLAWLASAFSTQSRNGLCCLTPSIRNIAVRATPPLNSSYCGKCSVIADSANVPKSDSSMLEAQNSWQAVVGHQNLIQGYPVARRPGGYPGLEISFKMLLYLMQAKDVSVSVGKVLIKGPERSLQLVNQTDNICLWHPFDTISRSCSCGQVAISVDSLNLEPNRHILGSCRPQDSLGKDGDRSSMNAKSSDEINAFDTEEDKSQSSTAFGQKEPVSPFHRTRSGEVRRRSASLGAQIPVLEDHPPATPMAPSESNISFQYRMTLNTPSD